MGEAMVKDDPLTRIQREIIEVTEREREFKEGHFRVNRLMSESTLHVNGHVNGDGDGDGDGHGSPPKMLHRAVSTSHLMGPVSPGAPATPTILTTNGYSRRFTPQSGTKGIMQRFIASKGKMQLTSPINGTPPTPFISPLSPSPVSLSALPPTAAVRPLEGKPLRKGFVPVEEKIQKELREMKDREHELKKMRKKKRPFDLSSLDLSDNESSSESEEEEDIPPPGKLKATKSIGELYEALNDEVRSPSPRNSSSGQESLGSLKPAKSLAELCELNPGEQFLAPSSTRLIAQWESIIQQKQEAGAA